MNPLSAFWAILFLLVCFGIVGRIDYEAALTNATRVEHSSFRAEYITQFDRTNNPQ